MNRFLLSVLVVTFSLFIISAFPVDLQAGPPLDGLVSGDLFLAQAKKADSKATAYHGNVRSRVFHGPYCRYYDCGNCTAVFKARGDALKAGYRPCKICNP